MKECDHLQFEPGEVKDSTRLETSAKFGTPKIVTACSLHGSVAFMFHISVLIDIKLALSWFPLNFLFLLLEVEVEGPPVRSGLHLLVERKAS